MICAFDLSFRLRSTTKVNQTHKSLSPMKQLQIYESKQTYRYLSAPSFKVSQPSDVEKYAKNFIFDVFDVDDDMDLRERFVVLHLNRGNFVIGYELISIGSFSGTVADPKIILRSALLAGASGIILLHNHPSGAENPSNPDILLTRKIKTACDALDLALMDHLIVTRTGIHSFIDMI